jgi:CheY-like chemotaxis protein
MQKGRIMIVEDIRLVGEDIKESVTSFGHTVTAVVSSGEEALRKAEEDAPDLILMDIVLSGEMDGIETAERIHALNNIPVIFLTGYSDAKRVERAAGTRPFGYIVKPYRDVELRAAIEVALQRLRAEG